MKCGAAYRSNGICTRQDVDSFAAGKGPVRPDTFHDNYAALCGFNDFCRNGDFPTKIAQTDGVAVGDLSSAFDHRR